MSNSQKWLIIGAIWLIAIAILLGAFRGRYAFTSGTDRIGVLDTWTGKAYNFFKLLEK